MARPKKMAEGAKMPVDAATAAAIQQKVQQMPALMTPPQVNAVQDAASNKKKQ